jgi:hypothetical protein
MSHVSAVVCQQTPPAGADIQSCKGAGVTNPFNGNQCGYPVNLVLNTAFSVETVAEFYGPSGPLSGRLGNLDIIPPNVVEMGSGQVRVDFLAVGEEGSDPRCT